MAELTPKANALLVEFQDRVLIGHDAVIFARKALDALYETERALNKLEGERIMKDKVTIKCPYCQNEFRVLIDFAASYRSRRVVVCDIEHTPGCDRAFVIEYQHRFEYEVKEIEGER